MLFTYLQPNTGTILDPQSSTACTPFPQPGHATSSWKHGPLLQPNPLHPCSSHSAVETSREYAGSCLQLSFPVHAAYEARQRRMMRAGKEHASSGPTSTEHIEFTLASNSPTSSTLPFEPLSLPDMGLTFLPRPQPKPRKRSRAAADIDGEHSCLQKKKRRLRLFLITSRLSPQFSHPATNIVDRGSSKIAVWAKQKSLGRNLLRKAAILNHVRRRAISAEGRGVNHGQLLADQERERNELALARLEFNHGSIDTYTRPVTSRVPSVPPAAAVRTGGRFVVSGSPTGSPTSSRSPSPTPPSPPLSGASDEHVSEYRSPNEAYAHLLPRAQIPRKDYLPLPPSPLGLSNYDAFDADEDPYSHLDDEEEHSYMHLFDDDEDSVPFSPSAVTAISSTTMQTGVSQVLNTPPQAVQADLNILDHGEPVFGDYDQVDVGADTVWPSVLAEDTAGSITGSTSPNFHALFATTPSKRADSFATSPNFRPTIPSTQATSISNPISTSPNFAASTSAAPASPNFAPTSLSTCTSANITPSQIPAFAAPAASPNLVATAISPNMTALDAPPVPGSSLTPRRMSMPTQQRSGSQLRRNSDVNEEERRKRDLMFARFGS
jgi:hypothetical protein